jgi:hypothetical protein
MKLGLPIGSFIERLNFQVTKPAKVLDVQTFKHLEPFHATISLRKCQFKRKPGRMAQTVEIQNLPQQLASLQTLVQQLAAKR